VPARGLFLPDAVQMVVTLVLAASIAIIVAATQALFYPVSTRLNN
jgi:Na+-transporting NADH:ubiquinone oxidoreductase subunit NqrD